MAIRGSMPDFQASQRREMRKAQSRQKQIQKLLKEQAKLDALQQARLQVEEYQNQIEVLLSLHEECSPVWDWAALASSLPPPQPLRLPLQQFRAKEMALLQQVQGPPVLQTEPEAIRADDAAHERALAKWREMVTAHESFRCLARRICAKEHGGYIEALQEISPLSEITDLGTSVHFTVHDERTLECVVGLRGQHVIPSEEKVLTSTGKLSLKKLSKARFQDLYEDYAASSILRICREVFALLPIDLLLVHAEVEQLLIHEASVATQPVFSVQVPRGQSSRIDFTSVDPSATLMQFTHRGELKAKVKGAGFLTVPPLCVEEAGAETANFASALRQADRLRSEFRELSLLP